jgi:hypothetical protein
MVCPEHLELKFLTRTFEIRMADIKLLRSEGRGASRTLRIVHTDEAAPETIKVLPHHPAKWFDVFESLGIPTEDDAGLRSSGQLSLRSLQWLSYIEGFFWFAVVAASLMLGGIGRLLDCF